MSEKAWETIVTSRRDAIFTMALNRPDRLNAFSPAMSRELPEAISEAWG